MQGKGHRGPDGVSSPAVHAEPRDESAGCCWFEVQGPGGGEQAALVHSSTGFGSAPLMGAVMESPGLASERPRTANMTVVRSSAEGIVVAKLQCLLAAHAVASR